MSDAGTPPTGSNDPDFDSFPIRLRPLTVIRVGSFIGAVIIAAAGAASIWGGLSVGLVVHQGWILLALGIPFTVFGLWTAPTSLLLAITLDRDTAVVRGFLRTVQIRRDSITYITSYPSIVWVDARGHSRSTPVNALSVFRSGRASPNPKVLARVEGQWQVLRNWAAQPR